LVASCSNPDFTRVDALFRLITEVRTELKKGAGYRFLLNVPEKKGNT
jgi:hypothetical protein